MKHCKVYSVDHLYSSHANIVKLHNGEWVIMFSCSVQRELPMVHPPNDPFFVNYMIRSSDQGKTWSHPRIVPNFDWLGMENPGIAQLKNGDVLVNQWRYLWYPNELGYNIWKRKERPIYIYDASVFGGWREAKSEEDWVLHNQSIFPYVRADDSAYIQISTDNGLTFEHSVKLDTAPYLGAFSPKGCIELDNGDVLLSLGSQDHDPLQASFALLSHDKGRSWQKPVEVARFEGKSFFEPSCVQTASGKVLAALREEKGGYIHLAESHDQGKSWGNLRQLDLWGYPTHIIRLHDDRLLMVYGRRKDPLGIRVSVSADEGETWAEEIILRDDLLGGPMKYDLGYPSVIEYEPNKLFSVYYGEDETGLTYLHGTYFEIDSQGGLIHE